MSAPVGRDNRLSALIRDGRPFVVANPGEGAPGRVPALATAGADCLFIDCEEVAMAADTVAALIAAAHDAGMATVLRCPDAEPATLERYLGCGIDGIVVPKVGSAALCDHVAGAIATHAAAEGRGIVFVAQIETVEGRAAGAAIAGHAAVDLVLIGPKDLACSLGFAGDAGRREVAEAVRAIATTVRAAGTPFGLPVDAASTADWIDRGATFLYTHAGSGPPAGVAALRAAARRASVPADASA